jgi:hypothetical protein
MKTRAHLLLALPIVALVLPGCVVDNRASVAIQAICAIPTSCAFASTCDEVYIGFPTIDTAVSATGRVWLTVQLENRLEDNSNPDTKRLNTNDAHVDEMVVEYEGVSLPRQVLGVQFSVPAASNTVVSVEVIPAALGALPTLAAYATPVGREMIANLRMRGYYDDGTRFETGEFPITIRVCAGCVTACPAATCPPDSNGQLPIACL